MKHFTIETKEQAEALMPFRMSRSETPNVGDIVSPMVGTVVITSWSEYPKENAITFDQYMAIVRDEVTEDVMRELSDDVYVNGLGDITATVVYRPDRGDADVFLILTHLGKTFLKLDGFEGVHNLELPNLTASKLKVLVQILKGE